MQRIINSSVNRRAKVAPAHLLSGNKPDLNRGILTPHLSVNTHSRSTYIEDLISVQDKVLDSAVRNQVSYQDSTEMVSNTKRSLRAILLLYLSQRTATRP